MSAEKRIGLAGNETDSKIPGGNDSHSTASRANSVYEARLERDA